MIVVIVFRSVIYLRQRLYSSVEYTSPVLKGTIFTNINRSSIDASFIEFIKYFINFGFYKLGFEICLILLTISIARRADIFSVFYCIWLLVFILSDRRRNNRIWPFFVGFMAFIMPYQYLVCLGIPPGLCWQYPWLDWFASGELQWYFLPSFTHPLPIHKLYLDFAILFLASRQLVCFRLVFVFIDIKFFK